MATIVMACFGSSKICKKSTHRITYSTSNNGAFTMISRDMVEQ
jgi:hypothetical protein